MVESIKLWQTMDGGIYRTMAYVWCYSITAICFVSLMVRPAGSERFFQYRDHRDQRRFEHMGALSVHNKREAEVGVFTCTNVHTPFLHVK